MSWIVVYLFSQSLQSIIFFFLACLPSFSDPIWSWNFLYSKVSNNKFNFFKRSRLLRFYFSSWIFRFLSWTTASPKVTSFSEHKPKLSFSGRFSPLLGLFQTPTGLRYKNACLSHSASPVFLQFEICVYRFLVNFFLKV